MNAHARLAPALPLPLLRSEDAGVVTLALDRPASRNALSDAMMAALQEALDAVAADRSVKAVVLAANGPAFSAGHDLKEVTARRADPDSGTAYFADLFARCARLMTTVVELPQPVIAAVEGVATAAGCQLVASCDLAVAGADARFGTPGVNIGLFCSTPMVALSRNVPRKRALEMLLTGEAISATTAKDIGLVNRVVTAGTERDAAIALARKVVLKSAHTVRIGKAAFYRQAEMSLADAYRYAAEVMTENMLARDAEEGIGAFIEKRAPKWRDC